MLLAIGNGTLREYTYGKSVSELTAHQISTLTGILFTGLTVWLISRRWRIPSAPVAWSIGFTWLVMTLCFEFLFGHYIAGHSWARLLQDYNLAAGRIWPLFLLWILCLPYVFRSRYHKGNST